MRHVFGCASRFLACQQCTSARSDEERPCRLTSRWKCCLPAALQDACVMVVRGRERLCASCHHCSRTHAQHAGALESTAMVISVSPLNIMIMTE